MSNLFPNLLATKAPATSKQTKQTKQTKPASSEEKKEAKAVKLADYVGEFIVQLDATFIRDKDGTVKNFVEACDNMHEAMASKYPKGKTPAMKKEDFRAAIEAAYAENPSIHEQAKTRILNAFLNEYASLGSTAAESKAAPVNTEVSSANQPATGDEIVLNENAQTIVDGINALLAGSKADINALLAADLPDGMANSGEEAQIMKELILEQLGIDSASEYTLSDIFGMIEAYSLANRA